MKNALLITLILFSPFILKAQIKIEAPKAIPFGEEFVPCDDQINATFPGGIDKFNQYMVKNIRYPEYARKHHIHGEVYLNFVIDKDGSIKHVRVSRGVSKDIDEEAIRVLKNSPKWNPTKMCGKTVKTRYSIPINFSLDK